MRYGVPYKGSKNQIAEWVVDNLPSAENFYDLFCGGCAVTHRALLSGKYQNYICNDINPMAQQLFSDSIHGKYKDEKRWISREEFIRLRDTDTYVSICWSFGNNQQGYLYSRELEPYKKAVHYAVVYKDYSLLNEVLDGIDFTFLDKIENIYERKLELQKYFRQTGKLKGHVLQSSVTSSNLLQSLERLQSLEMLQRLESLAVSYEDVEIRNDSVIYCDIPYKGTDGYNKADFDYEKFYTWCEKQKELVIISEYAMPEDRFRCIASKVKRSKLCSSAKGCTNKTEKLFVPVQQMDLYNAKQALLCQS